MPSESGRTSRCSLRRRKSCASLGRLASGMAHEINNPLGGLFNAIDTSEDTWTDAWSRDTSISLIERGLAGIRDVVEAALATYRPERSQRPLSAHDFDDVRMLLKPELRRKAATGSSGDIASERRARAPSAAARAGRRCNSTSSLNATAVTPERQASFGAQGKPRDGALGHRDQRPRPRDVAGHRGYTCRLRPRTAVRAGRGLVSGW